jgi:hypothetical protein
MFKFFKRWASNADTSEARPAAKQPSRPAGRPRDYPPPPLPEVTEGNTEADWSLWEDSVNSQLQPLSGFVDIAVRDTESGDITAFDQVGKRDG